MLQDQLDDFRRQPLEVVWRGWIHLQHGAETTAHGADVAARVSRQGRCTLLRQGYSAAKDVGGGRCRGSRARNRPSSSWASSQSVTVAAAAALDVVRHDPAAGRAPVPRTRALEVALWNAKARPAGHARAREKHRAGNICNKLAADCEEITEKVRPQLLLLRGLGASSKRIPAVDTGGFLLRCAGVLAAAAHARLEQQEHPHPRHRERHGH